MLGNGAGVLGVGVRREVGQEGIKVAAGEDVALFAEPRIDPLARGEIFEQHGDVGSVQGMGKEMDVRTIGEGVCVGVVDDAAVGEEVVHFFEAQEAHEGLELVHFGVGADGGAFGFAVDGEIAEFEKLFLKRGVFEDQQTAFGGMEEFGRVEGKHGHVAGSGKRRNAKGMGGVVDDFDAVLVGKALETGHIARIAVDVHRNDGTATRGDGAFGGFGREAQGIGVDVGEDGLGASADDGMSSGHEGKGRGDDLPVVDAKCSKSKFQGKRSIGKERKVCLRNSQTRGKSGMEASRQRTIVGEPLVGPDFGTTFLKVFQRRQIRPGDVDGMVESFHSFASGGTSATVPSCAMICQSTTA